MAKWYFRMKAQTTLEIKINPKECIGKDQGDNS
jgi:hypothetical protein